MFSRLLPVVFCAVLVGGCSRPLTEEQKRARDLVSPIRGFVAQEDVDSARLTVKIVQYFGGFTTTMEVQGGKATITQTNSFPNGAMMGPIIYRLSPDDLEAWSDVVNLIVREELWNQGDAKTAKTAGVADGGEVSYEFAVGEHEGKFRLINAHPEPLQVFEAKVRALAGKIESGLSGTVLKQ